MTTVFDVPADLLIKKVAEEFKNNEKSQNKSIIKSTLYKHIKNNNSNIDINLKNSLTKIIKLPKPINAHNSSAVNIKISNIEFNLFTASSFNFFSSINS